MADQLDHFALTLRLTHVHGDLYRGSPFRQLILKFVSGDGEAED